MKIELLHSPQFKSNLLTFPENTIGIIRHWGQNSEHIGKFVIRFGNVVHTLPNLLKQIVGESWMVRDFTSGVYNIEVLPKGTELLIII